MKMNNYKISKEIIWAVSIIIVCAAAGLFLLIKQHNNKIIYAAHDNLLITEYSSSQSYEIIRIEDEASVKPKEESDQLPTNSSNEQTTGIPESNYDCPIDFNSLWETNKDVYAWITVPGTVIDYPILQHATDDSYYLNYTIDGIEGYPGCIYTENVNTKDFTDNNTVIYGHNMRNGTMFTDLHKFRDAAFFAENDTVYIYTPQKQLTYKIFAAYLYDDRHLMNSFDFSDPEIYADYLSEIQNMDSEDMNMRKEITVTDTDKIITLITCIREQPEKRVYVQAVLQPDNELNQN